MSDWPDGAGGDAATARENMFQQQIRPWNVLDPQVFEYLEKVPRESFVPTEYRGLAFADFSVPLPAGAVMMQPKVEARLLQALNLSGNERCLEVGTGSGHFAALLAAGGSRVRSYEIEPILAEYARKRLDETQAEHVTVVTDDGLDVTSLGEQFDVIALSGAVARLPVQMEPLLATGGRLVAIIGTGDIQQARLYTRDRGGALTEESLFETRLPFLRGAEPPREFNF